MFAKRLEELNAVIENCEYSTKKNRIKADEALSMAHFLIGHSRIVYVIGNGGSAGIASHFCTDLLRTLERAAATFSDSNILTCFANDFGYQNVFKCPISRNMCSEDLLVAISSSGNSENIIQGVKAAIEKKAQVITLSGFSDDNALRKLGDLNFWINSSDYGLVETAHFFLLHTIVDTCTKKSNSLAISAS